MTKQVCIYFLAFSLKRSLRALIPLMTIFCFTLEVFTSPSLVHAVPFVHLEVITSPDGQSVRVILLSADHFSSIRLTERSSKCLKIQKYTNFDSTPMYFIDIAYNTSLTPILYTRHNCSGKSARTDPSSVNVGTVGVTLQVDQTKICDERGQRTPLPDFTKLEDGLCYTHGGYIYANQVYYSKPSTDSPKGNGQSVRVILQNAYHLSSIRLTKKSRQCLYLQAYTSPDPSPTGWWDATGWIDITPNMTIAPILYSHPDCSGRSAGTEPSSVNVGTVGTTLHVNQPTSCTKVGQRTSLPDFTYLEDGLCFALNGYVMANTIEHLDSAGGSPS